ncbi:NUDIX hydrolase [Candidatus Marinamargulisbacteria bacterium]|nr:hypothetical protein [bacterium]MDA7563887.1 NUDIX hydrolase [Candidatus Marinamargulisbacteria bacterium]|tara:strand:+ start:2112 stop:2639 length:528 start_codon:yes stop_codon:yes gene_type:complete
MFCKHCGSSMRTGIPEHDTYERSVCTVCGFIDYENPKIITGVLPIFRDTILLCQRAIEPRLGLWTIPSGFMENNETVEAGALREAKEEAGIEPTIRQLYCIYNLPHVGQVYLLYLATLDSMHLDPGIETQAAQFFKLTDIPWDLIAFSSVQFALKHYVAECSSGQFTLHTGSFTH